MRAAIGGPSCRRCSHNSSDDVFAGSPIGWRTLEQERLAPIDRERIDGHDDFTRRRLRFGDI